MKVQMKMGKYVPDAVPDISAQPKSAKMVKVDTAPIQKINFVGEFLGTDKLIVYFAGSVYAYMTYFPKYLLLLLLIPDRLLKISKLEDF